MERNGGSVPVTGTSDVNKWLVLVNVLFMTLMACIDGSIVNVALPQISGDLHIPVAQTDFIVFSYLFTTTSTILVFGRLGDVFGKARIFKCGVLLFTLGSLLCGLCTSLPPLIFCRILQALGASASMATNLGIVTETFPASQRGQALGIIGSVVAIGTMLGPALGGLIVTHWSWEYIFFINIPIGFIAFIAAFRLLKGAGVHAPQRMDISGTVMILITTLSFCSIFVSGQIFGFTSIFVGVTLVVTVILATIFVRIERRQDMPLIDMSIFGNRMLSISLLCGFLLFVCNSTLSIILPLYLEDGLGYGADFAGLLLAFSPLIIMVLSPISGRLSDRIGAKLLTAVGLCICAVGLGLIATLNASSGLVSILVATGTMSLGWAFFQSPNNSLVMSFAPPERLGVMGGVNTFMRHSGMAIGVSTSTSLLFAIMSCYLGYHTVSYVSTRPDAFFFAFSAVFAIACAICVFAAILTIVRIIATGTGLGDTHRKER